MEKDDFAAEMINLVNKTVEKLEMGVEFNRKTDLLPQNFKTTLETIFKKIAIPCKIESFNRFVFEKFTTKVKVVENEDDAIGEQIVKIIN